MASLAESSLASVPIADLQSLQRHLLQPIAADAQTNANDPQAPDALAGDDGSHLPASPSRGDDDDEIADSVDAIPPPVQTARGQLPRLTPSKSMPTDMDAMTHETPSQHAFATMTRAVSFHGYAGGDTQPMDSQIYRDFTESMAKSSTTTPGQRWPDYESLQNGDTYNTALTDKSLRTVGEGETGFIDLANAWQQPEEISQSAQSATSDLEDLLGSPNIQGNITANSLPKTPALASNKRRRSGELLSSTATDAYRKTPGLSQAFSMSSKMPNLSVSQIFNQTQAPSSPMLDLTRSDPVLSRPSPNLRNHGQFSSPGITTSSPMLMMHNPPASTAGEPRDTYTSVRESQERRAARLRQELELEGRFGPGAGAIRTIDEEDEEDSIERRNEHKRMQRVLSDQALNEWNRYRAPSRPGSRTASSRKRVHTIDLITPAHTRSGQRVEFDISDDEDNNEEDQGLEVELPIQQDVAEDEDAASEDEMPDVNEENDVYDEFSQTILRSQRDPDDNDEASSAMDEEEVEATSEGGEAVDADVMDVTMDEDNSAEAAKDGVVHQEAPFASNQPAVADSQPEKHEANPPVTADAVDAPSMPSFVPGSQYPGKSQERVRQLSRVPNSSIIQQPMENHDRGVPSSPPFQAEAEAETVPANSLEASAERQDMLAKFQAGSTRRNETAAEEQEIAEERPPQTDTNERVTEPSGFATAVESNSVPLSSTARTHASDNAPSPKKPHLMRAFSKVSASQQSAPSPLKAAGVRRFAEMVADSSSAGDNGDSSVNVDDVIGGFLDGDDQNFIDILSSPPVERAAKRRKLVHQRSSSRPVLAAALETEEPGRELRTASLSPQKVPTPASSNSQLPHAALISAVQALRNSPSKADQLPHSTPEEVNAPDTPESVRRREEAGRNAVGQLLSARTARAQQPSKLSGTGRKAAANREREKMPPAKRTRAKEAIATSGLVATEGQSTVKAHSAVTLDGSNDHGEEATTIVPEIASAVDLLTAVAPERIFALFRGTSYNAFYPATWLSANPDGRTHKVRFDDTTVTNIDTKAIRALDIRPGDVVKVDFEDYRSKTWIVKGFGRKAQDDNERANGTDIYDHVTLKVQAKMAQRASLPASGLAAQGEGDVFEVLVTNIKLTHSMLSHFSNRVFTPPNAVGVKASRPATPSNEVRTPELQSPASRSRRTVIPSAKASALTSRLREGSIASASTSDRATTGMFDDMAFAISYAGNEPEKAEVTRQIRRHGGLILDQGFDELFVTPQFDEPTTPSKRSAKPTAPKMDEGTGTLRLKPEYQNLGFVALIADKHSRRAKYIQALSLGLPTLSGRWVLDSLDPTRNPAVANTEGPNPRSWTRYLLPAGESSYLGGAVRSRVLAPYTPASALLAGTVASREMMLKGEGVLHVAPKKGKGTWERRKAYAFLTLALGAGSVKRVADLAEAKTLLAGEGDKWAWVYVDEDVAEAANVLFGKKKAGAGGAASKKRKRGAETANGKEMCVAGMDGKAKVVGDEFVVQSLILGALVD